MMNLLRIFDQRLDQLGGSKLLALATCGTLLIGWLDYSTGYELSMSVFYLGPVALAAWYGRRWTGIAVAIFSSVSWYFVDSAAGHQYSYPGIAVWNALVRLGSYIVISLLLTALRESLRCQQHLASVDALTGLYGRRVFEIRLQHDLALGQRRRSALTLAYVDLDDFKAVNDTYGHPGGDAVLRLIGQVLQSSVRETDTAARIGGDEFAVIMPDADSPEAQQIVSRMTHALHTALEASGYAVTCSAGVVTFPESATTPKDAQASADALMYQVKHNGKRAVAFDVIGVADQAHAAKTASISTPLGTAQASDMRSVSGSLAAVATPLTSPAGHQPDCNAKSGFPGGPEG